MAGAVASMRFVRSSLPRLLLWCWIGCLVVAAPALLARAADPEVHGTGFAVARTDGGSLILTALHVVRPSGKAQGTIAIGTGAIAAGTPLQWQPATLVAQDEARDLALLATPATVPPLPLADWPGVPVGEELFAIGYPMPDLLGWTPKITQGLLNGLAPGAAGDELFQFSAPIHHGSSGSPLLRADGRVVGMVQAMMDQGRFRKLSNQPAQLLNYAVNAGMIAQFLERSGQSSLHGDDATPMTASVLFARARTSIVAVRITR